MVLTKYFSLFGLILSHSESIFVFRCGCVSGSNNCNLHFELAFLKKFRACKNFKIFCPSVLSIVPLCATLKQVNIFQAVFYDANLKS